MRKLLEVKALLGYRLWFRYEDRIEGTVDLSHLVGQSVFAKWNDPASFQKVRLSDYSAPVWGKHVDLCANSLHLGLTRQRPEDLFPNLGRATSDA